MFLQTTESARLASHWPTKMEAIAAKEFYLTANAWRLAPLGVWANVFCKGNDEDGYAGFYIVLIKDGRLHGYLHEDRSKYAVTH